MKYIIPIMSADLPVPMPNGSETLRHMPLMHSQLDKAQAMMPLAMRLKAMAESQSGQSVTIELRTFKVI